MKNFKDLYITESTNFRTNTGEVGELTSIESSTSTLIVKNRSGKGFTSKDVHNSKIYITKGKHKGKTIADVLDLGKEEELAPLLSK